MNDPQRPQMVNRVAVLLRAVSTEEPHGATTARLARATGLARATTHRILSSLMSEGLIDRNDRNGRWTLGPELFLIGGQAAERYDITDTARSLMRDLAATTGESVYLSTRRSDETVCIAHEEGSFPLRSHVLHVGIRLPLGVASAGLAILSHLPDREVDEYLDRVDLTNRWGENHSCAATLARIRLTRQDGYATNPALLVEGSWGMAAAVFDHHQQPAWAFSLTGVATRFTDERRPRLGAALLRTAHHLTRQVNAPTGRRFA